MISNISTLNHQRPTYPSSYCWWVISHRKNPQLHHEQIPMKSPLRHPHSCRTWLEDIDLLTIRARHKGILRRCRHVLGDAGVTDVTEETVILEVTPHRPEVQGVPRDASVTATENMWIQATKRRIWPFKNRWYTGNIWDIMGIFFINYAILPYLKGRLVR